MTMDSDPFDLNKILAIVRGEEILKIVVLGGELLLMGMRRHVPCIAGSWERILFLDFMHISYFSWEDSWLKKTRGKRECQWWKC